MAQPEVGRRLKIVVVYSPAPRKAREWPLELAAGATLAQALVQSVLLEFPELQSTDLAIGVWGRKASLAQVLQDTDRVEIYRNLRVDPKVARRERFDRQGAKTAGLFAKTRVGGKAGY